MATIYRCDKCHREFTEKDNLYSLVAPHTDYRGELQSDSTYKRDLCGYCWRLVIDLTKPDPKVVGNKND